jgi:hypothetical protein
MLHAYVERFDVMDGRGNILGWDGEVNTPLASQHTSFAGPELTSLASAVSARSRPPCRIRGAPTRAPAVPVHAPSLPLEKHQPPSTTA